MKKSFTLHCADRKTGEGEWEFRRCKDGMDVIDPTGKVVCRFKHASANDIFELPSFWRSIKHIVFTTDKAVVHFEPDARDVRTVREYLDDALLAGGVGAVRRLRNRALLGLLGGLALALACAGAFYLLDQGLRVDPANRKGYGRPLIIAGIVGLSLAGWGVYGVSRSGRLLRRWREEEADALTGEDVA
jgi:hypothetical protein